MDAFPPTEKGEVVEERKPEARELPLANPARLIRARRVGGVGFATTILSC